MLHNSAQMVNILAMKDYFLQQKTPKEIGLLLAQRLRRMRRGRHLSQAKLSEQSGISLGALKRFESCGEISLLSLIKLTIALRCDDQLLALFEEVRPRSIKEVIDGQD